MKTLGVMNSILEIERPNLVVLNGDLTSCEWVASQDVNTLVGQILAPLINRSLPFAATFGNYDASKTCSTRSMSERMWNTKDKNGQRLSFTTSSVPGPDDIVGTSNYFVPVYSSSDKNKLAMLLWFFDSRGGRVYQPSGDEIPVDGWVNEEVLKLLFPGMSYADFAGCVMVSPNQQ